MTLSGHWVHPVIYKWPENFLELKLKVLFQYEPVKGSESNEIENFPILLWLKSSYHSKRPQNSAVIDKIGKKFKATRIDLEHDIGVSAGV